MKLNIYSWGMCRTPVFPVDCSVSDSWTELKNIIASSSVSFYKVLNECNSTDIDSLPNKAKFTLWKYFNRARFRGTPYGEFASFSLVPINNHDESIGKLMVSSHMKRHRLPSWSTIPETHCVNYDGFVRSNTSFYRTEDDIRYFKFVNDHFHLTSIGYNSLIYDALTFCEAIQPLESLILYLKEHKGLVRKDIDYFIGQMTSAQLLLTDTNPNIIGEEYFKRTGSIDSLLSGEYIISERKLLAGALSLSNRKSLINAVNFLSRHLEYQSSETLRRFKNVFLKRYETKMIPLLVVLDPEVGIGYGNYAEVVGEDQLVHKLNSFRKEDNINLTRPIFSQLDSFLLNQIQAGSFVVDLARFDPEIDINKRVLPNTFSAIVELIDNLIHIKSIGGVSAGSLSGRFTLVNTELQKTMQSLVKIEEDANPDVLFFDIAYNGEKKIDNINRRASIYNYELPILSWSTNENIIDINDLYITVREDELVLYSKKYNKRVVPRLATAYNYTRSDLSLFRFLTDLQHQGVQSSLTYDIQEVLPNLDFYPRIVYESVILTPAKWRVPRSICDFKNGSDSLTYALNEVAAWLSKAGIGKYFICKEGDQTLLFCKDILNDIKAFLMYISGKKNIYIEEGFMATTSSVMDSAGQPYKAEFVVNFWHDQKIYNPCRNDFLNTDEYTKDLFLPGDQWLYYELYCHSIRANELLLQCIQPFVEANKNVITKWFFIRYNDPSYHIRFRLELKLAHSSCIINSAFNNAIDEWIKSKKVSEVKIKPYHREIERYGSARIQEIEEYFYQDSEFVLRCLRKEDNSYDLYLMTMQFIECTLAYAGYNIEQQFFFSKKMADMFAQEHGIEKDGFKIINSDYNKNLRARKDDSASSIDTQEMHLLILKAGELIRACDKNKRDGLAADLFHMHVNRLFNAESRMHELIVYQFLTIKLKRIVKSKVGR